MKTADALALVCVAAGIACFLVGTGRTARVRTGLPMMLDLFTAAGLLRLSGAPDLRALAVTAIVIAVRKLVTRGLRTGLR